MNSFYYFVTQQKYQKTDAINSLSEKVIKKILFDILQ